MKRKFSRLFAGVSVTAVMISSSVVNVAAAQPVIVQDQTIAQTDGLTFDSARQSNVAFAQPFEQIPSVIAMRLRIEPGNASRQVLLGNYVYGQNCFSVELTADQQLRYVEYAYENGAIVSGVDMKTASDKVISGEWVNLAIIRDVETQSVSIACDGEIIDTLQLDGSGTNVLKENVPLSEAHYIGTDSRHQYWFDGSVANISLWDETMSASAINEAINDGLDGNEDGLTHAYVLDEAVLSTADPQIDDLCGSGIYGTVNGFDLAYAPADMLPFRSAQKSQVAFEQAFAHIPDTIAMQVRVEPGNDVRQVLMGNYVLGENCFSVELTADQQLRYVEYVYEDGAIVTAIDMRADVPKLISGKWVNLAVIRDVEEQTISFVIDGEIVDTLEVSGEGNALQADAPLSQPHYLGTDSRGQYWFDGDMSRVSLWDTMLTPQQSDEVLDEAVHGDEAGLMHAYELALQSLHAARPLIEDQKDGGINGLASGFAFPDLPQYEKQGTDFSANDKDLEMSAVLEEIPLSMEVWVKMDPDQQGTRSIIVGNYYDAYYTGIPLLNFEITANGEPRMYWYVDGRAVADYRASGVNVYNGQWTHIAITCAPEGDQTAVTTYINGEAVHSQSMNFAPVLLNQPMKIGEDSRFAHYFKGSMADLRLWSTTRSAEEIAEHFDGTVAADANGLLGNWLLDEADADGTYADRSINGNDAVSYWIDDDLFAKAAEGYESIAIIPDTQSLSAWAPESFTTMTTWLRDHADELGIKLAIHVGDIVNERDYASEWNAAKASMQVLDGTIPYVFSPGNHDTQIQQVNGVWYGVRNTSGMNNAFPYAQYAQAETFGGAFEEGKMDNTYSYFTVAGQQIMTISLEQNPRDEVLEWANAIAAANPDRKIIVTTHEYLFYDGQPTTEQSQDHLPFIGGSNTGQQLWEKFGSKHENIVAIVSGHVGYPDVLMSEAIGDHGNVVQQILCDAQFMDRDDVNNGSGKGLGMVMILSFKEGSNEVKVNWYSTVREQFFRASDQYTAPIQMYDDEREKLGELIDEVMNMELESFTEASAQAVIDALAQAQRVYEDPSAERADLVAASTALQEAVDALEERVEAEKWMLQTIYDAVSHVMDEADLYVPNEAWDAFTQAYAQAGEVLLEAWATQQEVNDLVLSLSDAYSQLRLKPDQAMLDQLQDFVNKAQNVDRASFAEAQLRLIDDTMTQAQQMLETMAFSTSQFQQFQVKMDEVNALIAAQSETSVKPETAMPRPEVSEAVETSKPQAAVTATSQESVDTAADSGSARMLEGMIAAAAGVMILNRRHKKWQA